ncbi:hypothetical protein T08_4833 [Trichinella sp. T8]|nr:hypothetical protein T08_4833 [Trichinella sp. T8]
MNSNVQNLRTAAVSVNGRIGETELPVLGEWGRQYCAPYAERTPSFVRLCSCPLVNQLLLYIFPFRLRNTHAFSELLKLRFWFKRKNWQADWLRIQYSRLCLRAR